MSLVQENIRYFRLKKQMTRKDFAKKLGVSPSTAFKIESGEIETTVKRLLQMSKILDVPVTWFFAPDPKNPTVTIEEDQRIESELAQLKKMVQANDELIESLKFNIKLLRDKMKGFNNGIEE